MQGLEFRFCGFCLFGNLGVFVQIVVLSLKSPWRHSEGRRWNSKSNCTLHQGEHIQLPGLWSLGLGAWGSCEVECAKEAIPKFIGLPNPATCPFRQFTSPDERALPVNLRGNGSTATTSGAPASSSDRVSWHSRITLIRPSRDCKTRTKDRKRPHKETL